MRDYRKWRPVNHRVSTLFLDARNPRIPKGRGLHEQRELIAELVEHDNVYELAKSIEAEGYFPFENLIAVEEDGKTVVVEGNRRLAALKLLLNPELAPEAYAKKFRALAADVNFDLVEKVPTIVAPGREAAAPMIMQRHTRMQIERWTPLQQASFFRTLADAGTELSDLAKQYHRPQSEIATFLKLDVMYSIACTLELDSEVKEIVSDPRKFPATVLERLMEIPKVREFLGIEFQDQVRLKGKVDSKQFKRAYARLIADIVHERIDSRRLNKVEDAERYLEELGSIRPRKGSGSFDVDNFDIEVPKLARGGTKATATPRATKPRKPVGLIPSHVRCEVKNARIIDIFLELRKLRPDQFANACGVLLRVLLELSVGNYFEVTGQMDSLFAKERAKRKNPDWCPTLGQMMGAIVQDASITAGMRAQAKRHLNRLVSSNDTWLSLAGLDEYVHSDYGAPAERELRSRWNSLEPLFEIILRAPKANANTK